MTEVSYPSDKKDVSGKTRVRFVVATRFDEQTFFTRSLLAQSLESTPLPGSALLEPTFKSASGLAPVYNAAIERSERDDLLVFLHDDVYLDDWFLSVRLTAAISTFDVVGVAGSVARAQRQTAWWGLESNGALVATGPDMQSGGIKHLQPRRRTSLARFIESGLTHLPAGRRSWHKRWHDNQDGSYSLTHGASDDHRVPSISHAGSGAGMLDVFGPSPAEVKLLDGVMIAASASRLKSSAVRFDPRFKYHFYDLDFCRQCEAAGLRMGTWPIAIAHASLGSWSDGWRKFRDVYLEKWKD